MSVLQFYIQQWPNLNSTFYLQCVKEQKTNLEDASRQRAFLEEELRRVNSTRVTLSVPDLKQMEENIKVLYKDLRHLESDRFKLEKEKDQLLVSLQCMQER